MTHDQEKALQEAEEMQHLVIFFYLITLITGVASLAVSCFIYTRTKYRLLFYYIGFLFSFSLFAFCFYLVISYANLNLAQINFNFLLIIVSVSLLSLLLLMIFIPLLTHALVDRESPTSRNIIIIASVITVLALASSFTVDMAEKRIDQALDYRVYLPLGLFYLVILYSIFLKIMRFKRLDPERKKITKWLIILNLVFFPGLLYDLHLYRTYNVFVFTPVLYILFNLLFTVYIIRRYIGTQRRVAAVTDRTSYEDVLSRAGITSREKEILFLLLKGAGNKEIARTLYISTNTVKTHIRNIFQKLDVKSRFELAMKLLDHGS
jgi:DNA-binding CsgD family transcriptional regulator